jgi:hypothetical protein
MSAINVASAEALQNYTRKFWEVLSERMYFGFKSIEHATVLEGVKGQIVLTDLEIGPLLKRASDSFAPSPNIIKYRPRLLTTVALDIDFEINPKKFANTYLEEMRKKGQNGKDIPHEGQVMGGLILKMESEKEDAFWKAKKTATPSPTDLMKLCFDGAIPMMKELRGTNTPVPVSGGVYTVSNIRQQLRDMFESLTAEAKEMGVEIYMSRTNLYKYVDAYKAAHNGNAPMIIKNKYGVLVGCEFEDGMGKIFCPNGYGTTNFVAMTQRGNIVWATDDIADADSFKFVDQIKTIQFTTALRVGMGLRFGDQDYIAVNDLD